MMGSQAVYEIVLLIFSVLTFSMSVYFWFFPKRILSNRIMGILTLTWSFALLIFVMQSREFFCRFPHVFGLGTFGSLMFFPLLFLFSQTYLDNEIKFSYKTLIHFIPSILYLGALSPFYLQSASDKISYFNNGLPEWIYTLLDVSTIIIVIQGLIYSIMSMYLLQKYKNADNTLLIKKNWIKRFVVFNLLLWAVAVSSFVLNAFDYSIDFDLFIVYYFGLAFLALSVAYVSIQQPAFFLNEENDSSADTTSIPLEVKIQPVVNDVKNLEAEINSTPIPEDVVQFIEFFETNKPYLNPQLNLQKLSELCGFSRNQISEMLNTHIGKTFYDFLNDYRTDAFIKLIEDGLYEKHTLTYLYESAGFNSKATFNRFFKKKTGLTPTTYIKHISTKK